MTRQCLGISLLAMLLLVGCGGKKGNEDDTKKGFQLGYRESIRARQYVVQGQKLYQKHCANCHQEDGTGLAGLYPPLKDADYLKNNLGQVVCGMRHGINGPIQVNGKTYNQAMPPNPNLTDLDIAEIAMFVYVTWADVDTLISVKDTQKILERCEEDGTK